MHIADTEGFEAVSMRRVAAELSMGTMSLYHYVRGREDLISLMKDALMREYEVPDECLTDDWRASISAIAHMTLATLRRHPWAMEVVKGTGLGPGALRHVEQSMKAAKGTGLRAADRMEVLFAIDDYTIGFALREVMRIAPAAGPLGSARRETLLLLERMVAEGPYPELKEAWGSYIAAGGSLEALVDHGHSDERFDRGLNFIMDGIAANLKPSPSIADEAGVVG
ncbi:hypothetical protein AYO38_09865 [bacterium SCGC AG-212-C10]|nr:hypothetical protein AYO38_09865 [bacterium SCGC AG-212-C10]